MSDLNFHNLFIRDGGDIVHFHESCNNCSRVLSRENFDNNGDRLCLDCYDEKYSGCYGGGCIGGE